MNSNSTFDNTVLVRTAFLGMVAGFLSTRWTNAPPEVTGPLGLLAGALYDLVAFAIKKNAPWAKK